MPFRQDGASADSTTFAQIGYALPAARLIVEPHKLLTLKRGFEDECKRIRDWINANEHRFDVRPPGADPCSEQAAPQLGRNGGEAIRVAWKYTDRLTEVAESLGEIAASYGLMEDENAARYKPYQEGPR